MPIPTKPHYLATVLLIVQREQECIDGVLLKLWSREMKLDQFRELRDARKRSLSMIGVLPWARRELWFCACGHVGLD